MGVPIHGPFLLDAPISETLPYLQDMVRKCASLLSEYILLIIGFQFLSRLTKLFSSRSQRGLIFPHLFRDHQSQAATPKREGCVPTTSAPACHTTTGATEPTVPHLLCPFLADSSQDHASRLLQGSSRGQDGCPARFLRPSSDHSILLAPRTEGPCLGSSPSEHHPQP